MKEQGVDIVIALTHCGVDVDYRIAKGAAPHVDVIVGGHSHTYMYTVPEGGKAPGPDVVKDKYPAVVETDGHKVLIVQASVYAKYVGDLTVFFDKAGNVAKWQGAPQFLDTDVVQGAIFDTFLKKMSFKFKHLLLYFRSRGNGSYQAMERDYRCKGKSNSWQYKSAVATVCL